MSAKPPDAENPTRQQRADRRKDRRTEKRRRDVVHATRTLLEEEGPGALTASNIARAADLTASGIYYYFESLEALKSAVHVELFFEEGDALEAAIVAATESPPSVDDTRDVSAGYRVLAAAVRAKVDYGVAFPRRWRALYQGAAGFRTTPDVVENTLLPRSSELFGKIEVALAQDQARGALSHDATPRVLANLAYCQAQGVLSLYMAAEAAGTSTLFPISLLVDTALDTFRRAWWQT